MSKAYKEVYLTTMDAAAYEGKSRRTIRNLIIQGKLSGVRKETKKGNPRYLIPLSSLSEQARKSYMEERQSNDTLISLHSILVTNIDVKKKTRLMLLELGISPHVKGFHFLAKAINSVIDTPVKVKDIYRIVADEYELEASTVKYSIEYAIEIGHRQKPKAWEEMFPEMKGKSSCIQFIALMAETLR